MPSAVTADFSALVGYIKRLEKQDATALRKRVRKVVSEVGAETLGEIKASASWSTGHTSTAKNPHSSIPAATTLKTSFAARSAGVRVATNAKRARHARPLEGGSSKSGGGKNRHPVFERRAPYRWTPTFVNQPTRPFFFDNAAKGAKALPVKLQQQLAEIAKELGY